MITAHYWLVAGLVATLVAHSHTATFAAFQLEFRLPRAHSTVTGECVFVFTFSIQRQRLLVQLSIALQLSSSSASSLSVSSALLLLALQLELNCIRMDAGRQRNTFTQSHRSCCKFSPQSISQKYTFQFYLLFRLWSQVVAYVAHSYC